MTVRSLSIPAEGSLVPILNLCDLYYLAYKYYIQLGYAVSECVTPACVDFMNVIMGDAGGGNNNNKKLVVPGGLTVM